MQPTSNQDYKQLLTDVIKKQIVILGPDITLSKARNVKGLTVGNDGTVTEVSGNPQEVIQSLIDQFVQLSGLIVKKTMEPLLMLSQPNPTIPTPSTPQTPQVQPQQPVVPPPSAQSAQQAINAAMATPTAPTQSQVPQTPPQSPAQATAPNAGTAQTGPAKNPLAA